METFPPVLPGKAVTLRPIFGADTPLIVKWRNSPHVKAFLLGQEDLTPAIHQRWLESQVKTGRCIQFIIRSHSDGECGTAFLKNINAETGSAEFGIFIGERNCWGKGYGKEASALVIAYGFLMRKFEKIWLEVIESNLPAVHLYTSLGFKKMDASKKEIHRDGLSVQVVAMENTRGRFLAGHNSNSR